MVERESPKDTVRLTLGIGRELHVRLKEGGSAGVVLPPL